MRINIPGYPMLYAIDLLTTRRSVKPVEMTGPGPSPSELETILTIGSRVPDHGKIVPWRFIVFEGDARAKAERFRQDLPAEERHRDTDQVEAEKKRFLHAPSSSPLSAKRRSTRKCRHGSRNCQRAPAP
jgi:hypothetical protein